jgi:phosphatidylserine/phosphatidylglycerophosphate/cardiolipin synthase-like enzyme
VLVEHVIATINASPGYRRPLDRGTGKPKPCPTEPALFPSTIKIAVYSIADQRFARALVAAHRRCVSVQVLMNSHLTAVTSPSYGRILAALGQRGGSFRTKRSFARRCTNGCLGTSVLHSKLYLFSRSGAARDIVITGSSNMTTNAVRVQWNDLFTVTDNPAMYDQYLHHFNQMTPDVSGRGPFVLPAVGRYQTTFYPFRGVTRRTDPTLRDLRTIRCVGAKGTAGIRGRTVLYVAMHAWFEDRGEALARQVRAMVRHGCYVRVLYSFMSRSTYAALTQHRSRRLVVRRVLFPGPYGERAGKYSHMKLFAASGNVAGNPRAHVVWTGSTNWTGDGYYNSDDLTLRIASTRYYRAYVRRWFQIKRHRSSPHWAKYREPEGGGRAP